MALILIADDSWIARMSLNKTLKPLSATLLEAEDGAMAMEMIRKEKDKGDVYILVKKLLDLV